MTVAVLGGGKSSEREISLKSAGAVARALRRAGYEVQEIDTKEGYQALDALPTGTIVFPVLHGHGGEDGVIQAELERRSLPYLGTESIPSSICFDKWQTRLVLEKAGLPVAPGIKVTKATYQSHPLTFGPHVLKVEKGGSSIGTYVVHDPKKIDVGKVEEVFELDESAVLEEYVKGTEITVPILDKKALPAIEIKPPAGEEFDYENKYNGRTQELCPPQSIDKAAQERARALAERIHSAVNARHLSRVDMIVRPSGEIVILEINTMPGMTDKSLYPVSADVAGLPMTALVKTFVDLVKRDYKLD